MAVPRPKDHKQPVTQISIKTKRVISALSILIFIIVLTAVFWFVGRPMLQLVSDPVQYRDWVSRQGITGKLAFMGMMALQILVAFIPGEPLEIAAGYAFGFWEGTFLCLLGAAIGGTVVFLLVRRLGVKTLAPFFPQEKIQSLKFLQNAKRLNCLVFFLFFIPGTPKDILTYFVGLTRMKFTAWLWISSIARIPSVITSTIGGNALCLGNYGLAAWVFAATAAISIAGLLLYRGICRKQSENKEKL